MFLGAFYVSTIKESQMKRFITRYLQQLRPAIALSTAFFCTVGSTATLTYSQQTVPQADDQKWERLFNDDEVRRLPVMPLHGQPEDYLQRPRGIDSIRQAQQELSKVDTKSSDMSSRSNSFQAGPTVNPGAQQWQAQNWVQPASMNSPVQAGSADQNNADSIAVDGTAFKSVQTRFQKPQQPTQIQRPTLATEQTKPQRDDNSFNSLPLAGSSPAARVANNTLPTSPYTGMHRLMNVDLRQFETSIIETWGEQVQATATPDGRFVRVTLPAHIAADFQMMIDRKSQLISFSGDDELKDNWHRIVSELDSNADGRIRTFSTPQKAGAIRQVAHFMGLTQDDQDGQGSISIPPGTQLPTEQVQGLKNKVKIIEDPETGFLTLVGDKEDLKILSGIIDNINKDSAAKQPAVKRINLSNIQSEAVAEQIQELYDQGYAASNGNAQIIPQASPNSLIVVAQPEGVKAVENIVAEMDVAAADSEMDGSKTFQLKYISAVDARDRLQTFFGQANLAQGDNLLPSAPVIVISDFRSNRVTVKGAAQFIRQAEAFLQTIDVAETAAVNEVKIFPLRNTLAEELAIVIQDAINGQLQGAGNGYNPNQQAANQANQNQQQQAGPNTSQLRSPGLSLQTTGANGEKVSGGIMFDVRVTADRNSNSLVVTGPAQSMALVAELIKQLDRIPNAETQIKVFEIIHGDATALLTMLETLFGTDQTQAAGGGQQQTNLTQLPLQGTGADGQTLVNLRFSVDFRTNTIIASGPAADLQVVDDLINRLDTSDIRASQTNVYRLSNAPAQDISDAISSWLDTRTDIINVDPRQNSETGQANRGIIVVPETVSNSLIVSCLPEYREEIEGIIRALDRRPPMVKVKVLIAEVNLNTLEEFGVDVGIQDSLLFDRGTVVDAAGAIAGGIGFPFNNQQVANSNATFPGTLAGQALSNLGTGRINNNLGYGGLVLSGGNESVNILIRALKDRQCVRVLSKPHIVTLENLQGRISIGSEVPRVAGTTATNFGTTQDIEFVDVGVILEVTPRVSPDGLIVMAVNAQRSSVGGDDTAITIGFGNNGEPIRAPQIIETEANTTLMARSGQTVVFSGLIQETKSHAERGAPIISDLPVIGPLFKFESDEAVRSELLIIMTPYLITDEQDLAMLNQDEAERMHWCECDVAEIYGNTEHSRHLSSSAPVETYRPAVDPLGNNPTNTIHNANNGGPYENISPVRNARQSQTQNR